MSVTIVIPFYKRDLSKKEHISLSQMKKVFHNRHFSVVCPQTLTQRAEELLYGVSYSIINFPEKMFKSTRTYNRLLMSSSFYSSFLNYSHILICQLDVYVFKDELDYWIKQDFSFIGAPTFEGYSKGYSTEFKKTLNGGFSLRNVNSAYKILRAVKFRYCSLSSLFSMEKSFYLKLVRFFRDGLLFNYRYPRQLLPIINEDLYWSFVVPKEHLSFRVPSPEISAQFAFDARPGFLYKFNEKRVPMGIHAWWRYEPEFVLELIRSSQ